MSRQAQDRPPPNAETAHGLRGFQTAKKPKQETKRTANCYFSNSVENVERKLSAGVRVQLKMRYEGFVLLSRVRAILIGVETVQTKRWLRTL